VTSPRVLLRAAAPYLGVGTVALVALLAYLGPNLLHDWREARRVERDPHGVGKVTALRDTGEDNQGEPVVEVSIAFTTREGSAIATRTIERLRAPDVVRLWHNKDVDVWYDPSNPFDAVIRWRSRPVEEHPPTQP
jgi:hypothetical protein